MGQARAVARFESADVPSWAAGTLRKLADVVDVALAVVVPPRRGSVLLDAYLRCDRHLLRAGVDPRAPNRDIELDVRTFVHPGEAWSELLAVDPDLVLDFCIDPGSVFPGHGRLGTWYVRLGSPDVRDLSGRRKYRDHVFALDVVARQCDGRELLLERSISAVDAVSATRTIEPALWKATAMLDRCARRAVAAGGLRGALPTDPPAAFGGSALDIAAMAIRTGARVARRRLTKAVWRDEWFLAARAVEGDARGRFHRLPQAPNGYRADPFILERDGRSYLFFEEFDYSRGLGHLAVGILGQGGELAEIEPCYVPDFHVSYPCVFEYEGTVYMVPETVSQRTISLYRAGEFPTKWQLVRELVTGIRAVDPTVYFDGTYWWLFASVYERGAAAGDELFLWSAKSLNSEWTPHPGNPVVSDVRAARPAGMLFRRGEELIRPAQDGSRGYGSGITLRRIVTMTPEAFAEETVGTIDASWLPRARMTHTFNRANGFEVTDGEARRLRLLRCVRAIR